MVNFIDFLIFLIWQRFRVGDLGINPFNNGFIFNFIFYSICFKAIQSIMYIYIYKYVYIYIYIYIYKNAIYIYNKKEHVYSKKLTQIRPHHQLECNCHIKTEKFT